MSYIVSCGDRVPIVALQLQPVTAHPLDEIKPLSTSLTPFLTRFTKRSFAADYRGWKPKSVIPEGQLSRIAVREIKPPSNVQIANRRLMNVCTRSDYVVGAVTCQPSDHWSRNWARL